jgi:putative toxin-antitoxin system antitoxin component (TIGR02293 family)
MSYSKQKDDSKKASKGKPYPEENPEESFTIWVVNEPVAVYKADNFSKIAIIRQGSTKQDIDHFKNKAELDYESLAKMLNVTKATLFNRKGDRRFDSNLSERLMALRDLYSFGCEVFGSRAKFNKWMKTENMALQSRPIDLTDTFYGISEIRNIIGRIAYGVYS